MSRLALYLLGPPRIECDGTPIQVDTRKAVALLAYLAVTKETHRRASLVNLLWPEYDRSHSRASLRRTLYALNRALTGNFFDVDRDEIGLCSHAEIWLDVDEFRQRVASCKTGAHHETMACPVCAPLLAEALTLYRGDFLIGFGLRDTYNFDDWQLLQADILRRELAGALDRLVAWHSAQREFQLAIAYGKRRLGLDPLHEQAHRQLMRVYDWSGQRPAALHQYQECVRVLRDQLDVRPDDRTTQLHQLIREGRTPPAPGEQRLVDLPAPAHALLKEETSEKPLFVARETELAHLDHLLAAALDGRGKVAFVTGDAGCGKTALLREFTQRSQNAHPKLLAAWGHGNAHTGIGDPYLPFREVLRMLTGDVEAVGAAQFATRTQTQRLWHLLPEVVQTLVQVGPDLVDLFVPGAALVERLQALTPQPTGSVSLMQLEALVARKRRVADDTTLRQSALFAQYTQVLRTLSAHRPLLVALDDMQWADSGSINLLFHLGRQLANSHILIVAAYRPVEVALGRSAVVPAVGIEGDAERHPLEPVVNEFKRCFGDIEVDLERAEGRKFIDAFLDSEANRLGGPFRESLYQHTAGYPLFTVELLQGMQQRGDLLQDRDGYWCEGPALDWETLPKRVEAVIAERIGRLPQKLRETLTLASVEGETFTAEIVAQLTSRDPLQTIRLLSDALDRKHRLVRAEGVLRHGDHSLSRYRFRHILFQRHLYQTLDAVQRVHLHQAVGTALETLYGVEAGQVSTMEADAVQLARHFQEAGDVEKASAYLRGAGEKAKSLYANQEATEHFRAALALLETKTSGEPVSSQHTQMIAQIYESLADVLEWTGAHDGAQEAYRAAVAYIPGDQRVRLARLHRKLGNLWRLQRWYEDASKAYHQAEATLAQRPAEPVPEWWQEWVQIQLEYMWLYYWLGDWTAISDLAHQVRSTIEQRGTPAQCISFFLSLASMHCRRARYMVPEEAVPLCQTALAISLESESLSDIAWARFMLGFSQLWAGDLDEAEKQILVALALAERTGDIVHQSRCLTYLTILYRLGGQLAQAQRYARQSLASAEGAQMLEYTGTAYANLAWVAWRERDMASAEKYGQAALESWQKLPTGHSSCAFQWTAVWPLAAVALRSDQIARACSLLSALLDPSQQHLPDALEETVREAISAWEEDNLEVARNHVQQAIGLAQESGYL